MAGDAREAADLAKALAGQDAVLSALGSMKAGDELLKRSTSALVSAAHAGEDRLTQSDLDWTIVYATGLDKAKAGLPARIVGPGEKVSMGNGIARADVAAFMLAEVASPAHQRGKVVITAT